jgi:hypothetical protein
MKLALNKKKILAKKGSFHLKFHEDFSEHKITGSFSLVIITSKQGILSKIKELNNTLIVCKV